MFLICNLDLSDCSKIKLTSNQKKLLINQSLKITNQNCYSNLEDIKECTYNTFNKEIFEYKNKEDDRVLNIIFLGDIKWFDKLNKINIKNYTNQKIKKFYT